MSELHLMEKDPGMRKEVIANDERVHAWLALCREPKKVGKGNRWEARGDGADTCRKLRRADDPRAADWMMIALCLRCTKELR